MGNARALVVLLIILPCALGACKQADRDGRPAPGTERGDCRPDGTCAAGLLCLSKLCVRPPPADCAAVAEHLTSIELGNYAPQGERAPVVARYLAACDKALVSRDQGACIEAASDRWAAARCAPAMFPELTGESSGSDCEKVTARLRTAMEGQMNPGGGTPDPQITRMLDIALRVIRTSCTEDAWPAALVQCVLTSDTVDAMRQCEPQMPAGLQDKLSARMQAAMQATPPAPPPPGGAP